MFTIYKNIFKHLTYLYTFNIVRHENHKFIRRWHSINKTKKSKEKKKKIWEKLLKKQKKGHFRISCYNVSYIPVWYKYYTYVSNLYNRCCVVKESLGVT